MSKSEEQARFKSPGNFIAALLRPEFSNCFLCNEPHSFDRDYMFCRKSESVAHVECFKKANCSVYGMMTCQEYGACLHPSMGETT